MTTEERFEKIEAALRDLIVVSRTVLTSSDESRRHIDDRFNALDQRFVAFEDRFNGFDDRFNALLQAQAETEQKLSRLEDIVDKLIHFRGPNGQSG